jgi:phosphopantothenoylcysteine decarboxylase/phosphopantothenate--cysteine ligase
MLKGTKIIVGVSGSISAYKAPMLVRELIKSGAEVRVVMTPSAAKFVSPLVLTNLSKNPIAIEMFADDMQYGGSWHIHLANWCDAMIIAPASATTLARLAHGSFDTALAVVASALPRSTPLIVAPAMDSDMWQHPAVLRNVVQLERDGTTIIPPAEGELASGLYGVGRLPEIEVLLNSLQFALGAKSDTAGQNGTMDSGGFHPSVKDSAIPSKNFAPFIEEINTSSDAPTLDEVLDRPTFSLDDAVEKDAFTAELEFQKLKNTLQSSAKNLLEGKTILITAGPTYEKIDDVRFVGNYSSGKMGFALASEAVKLGANVLLIAGPVSLPTPNGVLRIDVQSASEMYDAVMQQFYKSDIAILAAAVADYAPTQSVHGKMKKKDVGDTMMLELRSTKDILASLGAVKTNRQILVGFALEATNEIENARQKLTAKNCDMIVLNSANKPQSGFGGDDNTITIISTNTETSFPPITKNACAVLILEHISAMVRDGE